MAVEVIKRGITKAEKHFKGSCTGYMGCGTEIKCLGSDLLTYNAGAGGMRDPREHNYEYVKCPVCGNQISNLKEIPTVAKWQPDPY